MSLLANLQRDRKKRSKPWTIADFTLRWTRPKPQSADQMKNIAKALTRMYGGTVTEKAGGRRDVPR